MSTKVTRSINQRDHPKIAVVDLSCRACDAGPRTSNFLNVKSQKFKSFTLLARMTENRLPDKLPSSREGGGDPENHLDQVVEVQKTPNLL